MTCCSCGPSPSVTPLHTELYGFIRSPVAERGNSLRKTSRSSKLGNTFSMPTIDTRVSGKVRHIRPLPSDSTITRDPVSASTKLPPETAISARRNFSRKCRRAALASSGGFSEMSSGAGRP